MEKHRQYNQAGYYVLTLLPASSSALLKSNNERAFVISLLQDLLTTRSLLEEENASKLAVYVDLLAFSILKEGIQLIAFSLTKTALSVIADIIQKQLVQYHSENGSDFLRKNKQPFTVKATIQQLAGPHDALQKSLYIHLNHVDWEYDRYSSIGFYLHDRRGDWVRLWRLSHLFENNPKNYYALLDVVIRRNMEVTSNLFNSQQYAT